MGDLDGDGWDDIVWYAPGTSAGEVWFGGATAFTVVARPVVGSYRVAVGDFDCDGRDEVYWHAPGSPVDRRWDVAADRSVTSQAAEIAGSYRLLVANLDGDTSGGHPCDDLVLHAPGAPVDRLVYGGPSGPVQQNVAIGGDYRPFAGDLNGDGRDEVVWYAAGAAGDVVWSTSAARAAHVRGHAGRGELPTARHRPRWRRRERRHLVRPGPVRALVVGRSGPPVTHR